MEVDETSQTIRDHGSAGLTGLRVEAERENGTTGLNRRLMFGDLFTY
jgi:hypothetical protein